MTTTTPPAAATTALAANAAIAVDDLVVRFGPLTALAGTTLQIGGGEFVSLLGPSGCGKTTLLKVLGGLVKPTEGNVRIGGLSVAEARKRQAVGFVFQAPTLLPWRRALGNAGLLTEIVGKRDNERLRALMKEVGLEGFERSHPAELSGGMQQRLSIVRALALDPQVLLMDEPFAALDAMTRDRLGEVLLRVWGGERPVVFVTHSIEEAAFLSDRVIVMSARPGRVIAEVAVDLPRPRTHKLKESPQYYEMLRKLRQWVDEAQSLGGEEIERV